MARTCVGLVAVAALLAAGRPAPAQPTQEEFLCEYKGSDAAWKLGETEMRCVILCERSVRGGTTDPSECVRPFSGATQGCVNGAQGKETGRVCKACNPDAPECYGAADCNMIGDGFKTTIEGQIDPLLADAYCDDSASPDGLTAAEGKCQDTVVRYLGTFLAKKAHCLAKCHAVEFKSGQPVGTYCSPGSLTDPTGRTQTCPDRLSTKARFYIDRGCNPVTYGADPPECHNGRSSSDWVALAESAVDGQDASFFCEQ